MKKYAFLKLLIFSVYISICCFSAAGAADDRTGDDAGQAGAGHEYFPGCEQNCKDYIYRKGRELSRETLETFWKEEVRTFKTYEKVSIEVSAEHFKAVISQNQSVQVVSQSAPYEKVINGSAVACVRIDFKALATVTLKAVRKYARMKVWFDLWRNYSYPLPGPWELCGRAYELHQSYAKTEENSAPDAASAARDERPAEGRAGGPLKKWTLMIFMNADNSLDKFGATDAIEIEKTPACKDLNIVIQLDRLAKPTRRYDMMSRAGAADDWGISAKKIQDMGEVDMGDYNEIAKFVKWSAENYPAEKYMLVIWNHGSGWRNREEVLKGISYDSTSKSRITTPQLGEAVAQAHGVLGRPVDVLGFDACLMQMIEVVYEVRENARFVVASEDVEPADGWPYSLICPPLAENSSMTPLELAKMIPQAFARNYPNAQTTQSAIDCSKIDELASAAGDFSDAILSAAASSSAEKAIYKEARGRTQRYYVPENVDLARFVQLVTESTADAGVRAAGEKFLAVFGKAVVQNCITGSTPSWTLHSNGLAVYLPKDGYFIETYSAIKFSAFKWDEMVKLLMD